jgi:hypothetical protein
VGKIPDLRHPLRLEIKRENGMTMSLQHVVLLTYEDGLSEAEEAKMFAEVRGWPVKIGGFEELRLGRTLNSESGRLSVYVLYMLVADQNALIRYQQHEEHKSFQTWIADHRGVAKAYDHYLDENTVILPAD